MPENSNKFEITGLKETAEIFDQLAAEIGDKKATSAILRPAVIEAMQPVLAMARLLAPKGETGLLAKNLTVIGRRPTKRDRRSKYVSEKDSVIAMVTTKPIEKKHKQKFDEAHQSEITYYLAQGKGTKGQSIAYKNLRRAKKKFYGGLGYIYDGRATAMEWGTKTEFGTARVAPRPFLRPALESQAYNVTRKLGEILKARMEKFRAKHMKR